MYDDFNPSTDAVGTGATVTTISGATGPEPEVDVDYREIGSGFVIEAFARRGSATASHTVRGQGRNLDVIREARNEAVARALAVLAVL